MKRVIHFWFVRVLGRAIDDAFKFGRVHLTGTSLAAIGTLLAAITYSYFRGPDAAYDKVLWYSLNTLAGFAIVFGLGLTVFFVRTPLLLVDEASADAERIAEDLTSLESELSKFRHNHAEAMQAHSVEKAKLTEAAETARKPDPETSIKVDNLKQIIADYQTVVAMCDRSQQEAIARFYSADRRGVDFVRAEKGDVERFNGNFAFTDTYTTKAKWARTDFDHYKAKCNHRIQFLTAFLKHYQ